MTDERSGVPEADDLENLRQAVMKASPPRPGRHLDGILVLAVWASDDDPDDGVMDLLACPAERLPQLLHLARTFSPAQGDST